MFFSFPLRGVSEMTTGFIVLCIYAGLTALALSFFRGAKRLSEGEE